MRFGITDLAVLSRLLGAGLFLPLVVTLVLCLWIARDRKELMLFPLLSAAAISSNTDFFIISESNVLVVFFWPLLFLITLRREWTTGICLLGLTLAVPTLLSYESMVFFGPVLLGVAIWRARERYRAADVGAAGVLVALCIYFSLGIVIGAWFIIHPRAVPNFQSFLEATRFYRDGGGNIHWLGLLSLLAVVLVAASVVRRWPRGSGLVVLVFFAVACGVAALAPALWPSSFAPDLHKRARILNAYVPPLLGLGFLVARRKPLPAERWKYALALATILASAQVIWHAIGAKYFADYLDTFRREVATREGLVPFEQSVLSQKFVAGRPVAAMNTLWTMPPVSILLSPHGRVQAMVRNPDPEHWQAFRPEHPEKLPDLSRYGITFDAYTAALERQQLEKKTEQQRNKI
jgi:hypothetical protein